MDYIQSGILNQINFLKEDDSDSIHSTISQYYRLLFEYHLMLMFACIWTRKEDDLSIEKRREIIERMGKPILGTTLSFIFEMNSIGDPVFNLTDGYKKILLEFINKRNKYFGHRIIIPHLQEAPYKELWLELEKYYLKLQKFEENFWGEAPEFFMRKISSKSEQLVVFSPSNRYPQHRTIGKDLAIHYQADTLYLSCDGGTFKISPFITTHQRSGVNFDFYYFTEYKLQSGKFDYYLVSEIRNDYEWSKTYVDYFTSYRKERNNTICRANGVVSNKFESNYDYFIDIPPFSGHVAKVWDFLINNQSTVCLTIRGGGGIGKTAIVHYICMKYIFESMSSSPKFNYVIFCSAKDREFKLNAMTERGQIFNIDSGKIINSYNDILQNVSRVLELNLEPDSESNIAKIEEGLLEESGVLLIIDDFETLLDSEKNKVVELIKRMKIGRHKILITTRSQYLVGADYDVSRMNQEQVISFMKKRFENIQNSESIVQQFKNMLDKNTGEKIYEITMGLPLLAIQLATLLPLKGFSTKLLSKKSNDDTEDFLLGRLYEYFSTQTSKLLFIIIAFFVKYDMKTIPSDELQIFYKLYCSRYNKDAVDFENDLADLKKWNIIQISSDSVQDSIQVSNNISNRIFDKCIKSFMAEFPSENVFDERIFKIVFENGMSRGILKYAELEDSFIDKNILRLFAFDNVAKYINRDRFKLIEIFIEKSLANNNKDAIQELYFEGKKYFDIDGEYESVFVKYGIPKENPPNKKIISFDTIVTKLENILDEVDEVLKIKTRELRGERLQGLRNKISKICNTDLKEALDNFSPEDLDVATDVEELLEEISDTNALSCTNNENYKKLKICISDVKNSAPKDENL